MLIEYDDITSRINEEPKWYTPQGVPRYCDFSPRETGVYVKYAILAKIMCQSCHRVFIVGEGYNRENTYALLSGDREHWLNDIERIAKSYHFGDPPNHGCVGDTMNCIDVQLLEVWEQSDSTFGWNRRPDLEAIDIMQDWAK